MPEHIMLMGCKVSATKLHSAHPSHNGSAALKVKLERGEPSKLSRTLESSSERCKDQESIQNIDRFKQDMGLLIEFSGDENALGAMKTFLKFAATSTEFPRTVKGQANVARTTEVINQLIEFKRVFKELNDQHGIHPNDAKWVKDKLEELQKKAERINVEGNGKQPDVRNLHALIRMVSEFKSIALPGETALSNTPRDTPVAEAAVPPMAPSFASPVATPSLTQFAPLNPPPPSDPPPPLPLAASTTALPITPDEIPQEEATAQTVADAATTTADSPASSAHIPTPPPIPSSEASQPPVAPPPASPILAASVPPAPPPPPPSIPANGIQAKERSAQSGTSLMDEIKEGRNLRKVVEDEKKKSARPPENPNDLSAMLAQRIKSIRKDTEPDNKSTEDDDEWGPE